MGRWIGEGMEELLLYEKTKGNETPFSHDQSLKCEAPNNIAEIRNEVSVCTTLKSYFI